VTRPPIRRWRTLAVLALVWSLVAVGSGAAQAPADAPAEATATAPQDAPPTFAGGVEQVVVDVVVIDRKGNPVGGLTADDLVVTEDGVVQKVVSFEAVELPERPVPATRAAAPVRVSTNAQAGTDRARAFVVVFDNLNMTPFRVRDAKGAVASFLETGVRDGDYVTLISTGEASWWTARMPRGREQLTEIVKRLDGRRQVDLSSERMSDWEAMRIHLHRDKAVVARVLRRYEMYGVQHGSTYDLNQPFYDSIEDPYVTSRATEVYNQAQARINATLTVLERALNGLATAKGRKSVILVSEGFIDDTSIQRFKRVYEASRRANAAVYFLNARGLEGVPSAFTAQFGPPLDNQDIGFALAESFEAVGGSENIAANTGGFTVKNTNDLEAGIRRIADETRIFYLLGYVPANTARDGGFRQIKVALRDGKGLRVRARSGYYAPSDEERKTPTPPKAGVDPVFQAALDSPWTEGGIPLRMTAFVGGENVPGKASVQVVTEVDLRGLELDKADERYQGRIEFLLVVAHHESGEYFQYDQSIDMNMLPSTRERVLRTWLPIVRDFELQPGDYQAKIVVRLDPSLPARRGAGVNGPVGSVIHEFEVPPLQQFRVSTPVLSDTNTAAPGAPPEPAPLARREFPQGSELLCRFEVHGAARGDGGMPRVTQGAAVRRLDGAVYASWPATEIRPTSLGQLSRMFGVVLDEAVPGDYEVVLAFRDEITGETLELHEPFKVVQAIPPRSARSPGNAR
jgi:VWFA-related protein